MVIEIECVLAVIAVGDFELLMDPDSTSQCKIWNWNKIITSFNTKSKFKIKRIQTKIK